MGSKKTVGVALLVIGVVLLVVSLIADVVGIGASPTMFGYRQIAGTIVGAIAAVVGLVLAIRK